MAASPDPLQPTTGWGVLHLFCRLPAPGAGTVDVPALLAAEEAARKGGNQVVAAAMLGHKADVGLMVLGPDLWQLRQFQTAVQQAGLVPAASYVSLTELSEYAAGVPEELKQARLFPSLPPDGKRAFCFYPMSKRRAADHNWYALDFESRKALMYAHGAVGRTFHGRILQLITGSTGLDDWEWGVTLFGVHPDDLKACVYQMRFDEASAHYAEFGPFYTGMVADLPDVLDRAGAGG
ncbi:MAG TPA: chlorite dismutase family protein [Acidimicrobiales bacterium]|nr:chlorite dismutase family protein [Acidimicrobiales bacterium]